MRRKQKTFDACVYRLVDIEVYRQSAGLMTVCSQEPLNSEDDVSDEEDQELFDTENVVVCQYDKV